MAGFSVIDTLLEQMQDEAERQSLLRPAEPWPEADRSKEKTKARRERANSDYAYFDRTYFSEDMYSDGYAKPGKFHRDIVQLLQTPGAHVLLGPRKHGKTVTAKKVFVWLLLSGRVHIAGVYCDILDPKAYNMLEDVHQLIASNDRIMHDWKPEFIQANKKQLQFRVSGERRTRTVASFAEGRSVRGFSKIFSRPDLLLCDDVETLESSFEPGPVEHRIRKLAEAFQSLSDNSTMLVLGNNIDERCALNRLLIEQDQGILAKGWQVRTCKAWNNGRPLWRAKYPAASEAELRDMCRPKDEADWQANFQQNPQPPAGFIFRETGYNEYDEEPDDLRGVLFCDPNLSKKGLGDTTSIVPYGYSAKFDEFFIPEMICRSFSDSNTLLDEVLKMLARYRWIVTTGFDGNVNQESIWTNNVRNWCRINNAPFPRIEYRRYNVDDRAKNAAGAWSQRKIRFKRGWSKTEEGRRAIAQILGFHGKKANKKDDAPDTIISAHELIHERGMVRRRTSTGGPTIAVSVADTYSF